MYEGPKLFGEDTGDAVPEEPFDYFEHAKKLREERQALEAEKKAERQAKDAEKKAEKEARLAKKIADKATEKLEEKTDKLADKSASTKEEIADAKAEVAEIADELKAVVSDELPAPVEMNFTNGSEYIANLEEGEEAVFELNHTIEKVEETVSLADEVKEQAEALARARAALENVDADHVGASFEGQEENTVVFGETGPQDDVLDRLKHTWETPVEEVITEAPMPTAVESYDNTTSTATVESYNAPMPLAESSSDSYVAPSPVKEEATTPTAQNDPTSIERFGSGMRNGASYVGGIFSARALSTKNKLERTNAVLSSETQDLQRELQTIQARPTATRESIVGVTQTPESLNLYEPAEVRGTNEPAIPRWISQIESDVAKGKVPELKKWQIDVLRAQHPELLKKYEKLDQNSKERIKQQSKESIRGVDTILSSPVGQQSPGELPAPVYALPSYMTAQSAPPTPVFEYASTTASLPTVSNGSVFSNEYLTIVVAGGILFGAVLIAAFGF